MSAPWGVDSVMAEVIESIPTTAELGLAQVPNLHELDDESLRERLAKWGAYLGYLQVRSAEAYARRESIKAILDAAIHRRMADKENKATGRRLKDSLTAEIIAESDVLKGYQRSLISADAEYHALTRIETGLDTLWRTISRLLSSRQAELDRLRN